MVITTFKNPKRLRKSLLTVTRQTYPRLEIIVVDGSNWQTNETVAREFGNKIIYKEVEPEVVDWEGAKAVQHQRNIGCKCAKGKWIAMLDDDDEWDKDKIKKQIEVTEYGNQVIKMDFVSLITCWTKTHTENGVFFDKPTRIIDYKSLLKNFNLSNTSSYLIRKKTLEEVGWWDENIRGMHEYDVALKIAKNKHFIYSVREPLLIRNRDYHEQLGSMYWKIAEQFEFWKKYGGDVFKELGYSAGIFKGITTVGLIGMYSMGYVFKNKIWNVIYPIKDMYEENV